MLALSNNSSVVVRKGGEVASPEAFLPCPRQKIIGGKTMNFEYSKSWMYLTDVIEANLDAIDRLYPDDKDSPIAKVQVAIELLKEYLKDKESEEVGVTR